MYVNYGPHCSPARSFNGVITPPGFVVSHFRNVLRSWRERASLA